MIFSPERRSALRRALAWSGLLLMAVGLGWLLFFSGPRAPLSEQTQPTANGPVSLLIIDAGHGGLDSGAMRNGVLEKDLTLDVARRVEGLARFRGLRTMMTRPSDISVSLAARAAAANRENECVFVSIHFDEGNRAAATGVQTFYATRQRPKTLVPAWLPFLQQVVPQAADLESQSLAGFVQEALVERTHAFDRGTHAEQFFVVANVRHPAVLVEGGFLSNNEDIAKLMTGDYRQELASGITEGIVRYRGVARARADVAAARDLPAE
ncbi:MAG: N-acetylmuramoyl-L-alanine amidase [Verrucomicrobiota bacterium]|nr:N-acetylmuramoyl-L-alanine amidase [Verrucomicrobiota bacterium]